jgi:hypothetical protein
MVRVPVCADARAVCLELRIFDPLRQRLEHAMVPLREGALAATEPTTTGSAQAGTTLRAIRTKREPAGQLTAFLSGHRRSGLAEYSEYRV